MRLDVRDLGVIWIPRIVAGLPLLLLEYLQLGVRAKLQGRYLWAFGVLCVCSAPNVAGLHGVESSRVSDANLNSLHSASVAAAWSARRPLALSGAVLGLLDDPDGCDPDHFAVWSRFRMIRRYLAHWPAETTRICRMLDSISRGAGAWSHPLAIF